MTTRINRDPEAMVAFANKLEVYNDYLKKECQIIFNSLDICQSSNLLNDATGKLAADTINNLIDCILDGVRDSETIVYSLKDSAKPLFTALELGGQIRGR